MTVAGTPAPIPILTLSDVEEVEVLALVVELGKNATVVEGAVAVDSAVEVDKLKVAAGLAF